eukprot:SAG31_NODE_359_length_17032_cov_11.017894_1_plen_82_part_00
MSTFIWFYPQDHGRKALMEMLPRLLNKNIRDDLRLHQWDGEGGMFQLLNQASGKANTNEFCSGLDKDRWAMFARTLACWIR